MINMKLQLTRPIAVFDLETTGTHITQDRIVQIAIMKIFPDGTQENFETLVNPKIPIPQSSSDIHNIYEADVKDKPDFRSIAGKLIKFLANCDLAGYNSNKFDIPFLAEEFLRAGIEFDISKRKLIDVQNIFHKMEKRTLKAAYKFYTGKLLSDAHDAMADTKATYEILLAQIEKYEGKEYHSEDSDCLTPIKNDIQALHDFSFTTKNLDFSGRIILDENDEPIFNFGKHKGKSVKEIFRAEPSYYGWMMQGDFSLYTKKVIKEIMNLIKLEKAFKS